MRTAAYPMRAVTILLYRIIPALPSQKFWCATVWPRPPFGRAKPSERALLADWQEADRLPRWIDKFSAFCARN